MSVRFTPDQAPTSAMAWRVRIILPGAMLHVVSSTEPQLNDDGSLVYDEVPDVGDTIGRIDWDAVTAISWRYCKVDLEAVDR